MVPIGNWSEWIITALASGRVGLALHLADARDQVGGRGAGLPSAVIEGLLHGRAARAAYDGAWHRYEALRPALVDSASSGGEDGVAHARTLMLLAGALRPALLQSQAAVDVAETLGATLPGGSTRSSGCSPNCAARGSPPLRTSPRPRARPSVARASGRPEAP